MALLLLQLAAAISIQAQAHELRPAVADLATVTPHGASRAASRAASSASSSAASSAASPAAGSAVDTAREDAAGASELQIQLRINIEALLAGIGIEHDDTDDSPQAADYDALRALEPAALRSRLDAFLPTLTDGLSLTTDTGERLQVVLNEASIPEVGDVRVARDASLEFSAPLPDQSRSLQWSWSSEFGPVIVRSVVADGPGAFSEYLLAGDTSGPLPLDRSANTAGPDAADANDTGDDASATASASASATASAAAMDNTAETDSTIRAPAGTFSNYLRVGFVHIVPLGLDHILFVIGLFLLAPRARPILWQVTTFTLAHSITLACATLGWINVSGNLVEPLIALSIVAICIENLFTTQLHRWRLLIVFGFGLLHGLGFASVLQDVGGSATGFLTTLIAFNLGVEIGQLLVVALCFLLVGFWFRDKPWYRHVITIPASLAIGAVGLFWFVQRSFGWWV